MDLCAVATSALAARPRTQRLANDVRALRQALGCCWSVAVAADPAAGKVVQWQVALPESVNPVPLVAPKLQR